MPHAARFPSACRTFSLFVFLTSVFLLSENSQPRTSSQQDTSGKTESQPAQKQSSAAKDTNTEEVSTRDTPPTFKVRVNLVLVRAVVRDAQGKIVNNLKKEDFLLTDNRKPQVITTFSVETPDTHKIPVSPSNAENSAEPPVRPVAALPQRFVAMVLDDTNMLTQDTAVIRDATTRLYGALAPSDRVGIFSTSGQISQDFTDDRVLLDKALLGLTPRPVAGANLHECPEISYYQADLIVNQNDPQALAAAAQDALQCAFQGDQRMAAQALSLAQSTAQQALASGDAQVEYVYRHLEDTVRRLSGMPGQRVMALISPGFYVNRLITGSSDLVDRANRANIVINTVDARGLYTPDLMGDIADPPHDSAATVGIKSSYRISSQAVQSDILAEFSYGTGGTFFHNRNDLDRGLQNAVAAPATSYVLGFSPQNLKVDGRYHTLKVTLATKQKNYSVQARRGYFAPRTIKDPAEAAKEEIQEALFSQDEMHDLPVDLQTQFFRKDETQARLAVLTHVRVKGIPLRKTDGRNRDELTIATAIFDQNGNFVTGGEKIVEMRLLDKTVERLATSGFTVKSSFDIKPGTYLVRLVVREAEGSQMAARNGAINIPY